MVSNESLLFGGRREGEGDWFSGKYRFDLGPPIKCFSKLKILIALIHNEGSLIDRRTFTLE